MDLADNPVEGLISDEDDQVNILRFFINDFE